MSFFVTSVGHRRRWQSGRPGRSRQTLPGTRCRSGRRRPHLACLSQRTLGTVRERDGGNRRRRTGGGRRHPGGLRALPHWRRSLVQRTGRADCEGPDVSFTLIRARWHRWRQSTRKGGRSPITSATSLPAHDLTARRSPAARQSHLRELDEQCRRTGAGRTRRSFRRRERFVEFDQLHKRLQSSRSRRRGQRRIVLLLCARAEPVRSRSRMPISWSRTGRLFHNG